MSWSFITGFVSHWLVPVQNLIIYFVTGKSYFERIMADRSLPFPSRVYQIKNSIDFKASKDLTQELEQTRTDKNKSSVHGQIYTVIYKLELYKNLIKQIDDIRQTKVTSTEAEHLELFEKLWSRLVLQSSDDHEPMNVISKRWTRIGFQGSNPLTDFRGMGLLGLQCIERLTRDETTCLTYVNIRPPNDYSFAIGVINVVSWLVFLLEIDPPIGKNSHPLLTHFSVHPCNLDEFFRLFLLVFQEWHRFWLDQKANIMQFEQLSKVFRARMLADCEQWKPIQAGFSKTK